MKSVFGYYCTTGDISYLIDGHAFPPLPSEGKQNCNVISMSGLRRAKHLQDLLTDTIIRGVPGDFIEAGAWKGGLCIIAASVYEAFGQFPKRKVWVADSFKGIPISTYDIDRKYHPHAHTIDILKKNSVEDVKSTFQKFGFLDDSKVKWVEGYFSESFPNAKKSWTKFSVIRLDGDIYESIMDGLIHCYPFLSEGGYVIIDDYVTWFGARRATEDFLEKHNIKTRIYPIHHGRGEEVQGVFFMKPYTSQQGE